MAWHITESVDEFLAGAGEFLHASPVEHTVLLTITDTLRRRGASAYGEDPPVLGWCDAGAFVRTPPRGALLTALAPADATELAGELAKLGPLPSIGGPDAAVEAFAAQWQRLTGDTPALLNRQRLFRLIQLTPAVPPPPGAARVATAADRDLLIDWTRTFQHQLGERPGHTEEFVDDKLSYGGLSLWEVEGEPVSMAGTTLREAGMVRVQAVYTPRQHRAKGYAGAVVAAVSQAALDAGATDVVLFTDLANPTSNALYQRLGYTPIEDRRTVEFTS